MKESRSKKGTFFIAMGLLCITAALCLLVYNLWSSYSADRISEEVAVRLNTEIPHDRQAAAQEDILREMPVVVIDGNRYVGVLEIPTLKITLPVMESWSYGNLKKSPCRYAGTVYQDNMVIAAHNYRSHFGKLKTLAAGSEVIFTDTEGHVYAYEVASIETLQPGQVDDMVSAKGGLTLFTCTPGGQTRVTVRCDRVTSG